MPTVSPFRPAAPRLASLRLTSPHLPAPASCCPYPVHHSFVSRSTSRVQTIRQAGRQASSSHPVRPQTTRPVLVNAMRPQSPSLAEHRAAFAVAVARYLDVPSDTSSSSQPACLQDQEVIQPWGGSKQPASQTDIPVVCVLYAYTTRLPALPARGADSRVMTSASRIRSRRVTDMFPHRMPRAPASQPASQPGEEQRS